MSKTSELQLWADKYIRFPVSTKNPDYYDCILVHDELGEIPFTAYRHDTVGYGALAFMVIKDGLAGEVEPLPEPDWLSLFNTEKESLLQKSALSGVVYDELTEEQKSELQAYRSSLRDLEYVAEGEFADWPVAPEFIAS